MGRLLQAAVLVMSMTAIAFAAPKRKVRVETTPPGASVYIDSLENGAECQTPCTVTAPVGSNLIVRLDKHEPDFAEVEAGSRVQKVAFKLKGAIGTIRIIDAPKGAVVKINDEEKGRVGKGPLDIEVPAEPASVVVIYNGKTIAQELVEVDGGETVEVTANAGSSTPAVADTGDVETGDDDTGDDEVPDGTLDDDDVVAAEVTTSVETAPRLPVFEAGLATDIGFRRFAYTDGTNPFNNSGEVLIGPALEVWPGRLLGVKLLRGMSVFARVQFSVSHQKVTRDNMGTPMDVGATTFWGGLEFSLRNKWIFGPLGAEISGGFVRDQVEFSAPTTTVLDMVPSADYQSIRLGARVSYVASIEPYFSVENRIVLSGGELANRADTADASGYRVALGARTKLGPISARVEGALASYSWTFDNNSATLAPPGATDKIYALSLVGGYAF